MPAAGPAPGPGQAKAGRIFREESGRSVAALIRAFGDIDVAEDAVQEAFAIALGKWPGDGLPPNPGGWITTTARNRAIDRLRRESRGRELLSEAAVLSPGNGDRGMPAEEGPVEDDRLRLIFTCCHPALSTQAQVALTLRLLGGLSTREVARSFLVTEHTMAVRLARAKRKIKAARIPYRVPGDPELPGRLRPVLAVIYLIYTAGLASQAEPGLGPEAIRLARRTARVGRHRGEARAGVAGWATSPKSQSAVSAGPLAVELLNVLLVRLYSGFHVSDRGCSTAGSPAIPMRTELSWYQPRPRRPARRGSGEAHASR